MEIKYVYDYDSFTSYGRVVLIITLYTIEISFCIVRIHKGERACYVWNLFRFYRYFYINFINKIQ